MNIHFNDFPNVQNVDVNICIDAHVNIHEPVIWISIKNVNLYMYECSYEC